MQADVLNSLPAPDAESAAHSERCAVHLRDRIAAAGGSISFAEFMHEALYAPGLGYYAAGATKFGVAGDFVTAPEVSALFARVLARQSLPVLEWLGNGEMLELGAGSGRLAVDVLRRLDELGALPARYLILEVSPDLQQRQAELVGNELGAVGERVDWVDRVPSGFRGVIIANEVLDALPVDRFVRRERVMQVRVGVDGERFVPIEGAAPERLEAAVAEIESDFGRTLADGYLSEVSPGLPAFVADLVSGMEAGVIWFTDYGLSRREYYAPDRHGGWLRCHFRQRAHSDPFILPGIQDITSWVDFTSVASAAVDAGAEIAGYTSQAQFLAGGGIDEEIAALGRMGARERLELSAGLKMLTLPGQMGERFKCMALSRGDGPAPTAFRLADRTHTL